ncbi:hypothetical protein AA313_de0205599 [Arthrobotrys entomopaga]|nr:hypothetical protein AA313_de0205599 [Arthrobotrys entomopaga]
MPTDLTAEFGDKLAELATQAVANPPPAENIVHARLTGIDGTGNAALVSKVAQGANKYEGFALVFKHDTESQSFEWLQFITRQLVVDNVPKTGNLIFQNITVAYQLVNSANEIADFSLATGPQPANWNTCWKVDCGATKAFFRETYESVMSADKKVSAILDFPTSTAGVTVAQNKTIRDMYIDLPDDTVNMKVWLDSQDHDGIARAYFSDYLVKKNADNKYHILARFDFNLTWDPAKTAQKKDFTVHSVKATPTTALLDCHKAALLHTTTKGAQPFKNFYDKIIQ